MSPHNEKYVPKLVKNYKRRFPELDSRTLRTMIRLRAQADKHPIVSEAEKQQLTRALQEVFKQSKKIEELQTQLAKQIGKTEMTEKNLENVKAMLNHLETYIGLVDVIESARAIIK